MTNALARVADRLLAQRQTAPSDVGGFAVPVGVTRIPGVRLYDWRQALQIPTVFRCVDLISSCVAMLPWNVLKSDGKGGAEKMPADHRVQWLLHNRPSDDMGAFNFKKTLLTHAMGQGNGYAEIERDRRDQPYALHLIDDPDRVTPGRRPNGRLCYKVNQGGRRDPVIIDARNMFHCTAFGTDGVVGLGILEHASRTLAVNIALEKMQEKFFTQGMRTPGFLKMKNSAAGFEGLKSMMEFVRKNFTGLANFELPLPIDKDMEFTAAGSTFEQSQFIDLRKLSNVDLCRLFGVPPHLAFDLDKATFSNIEAQDRTFLQYGLLPRIKPLEEEADFKLLSSNHGGLYSKMNVNAFARGDMQARGSYYQIMRNAGVFTVNDILELEDRPTIGKDGDVRVMQSQYQPTGANPPQAPETPPPAEGDEPPKPAALRMNGSGAH